MTAESALLLALFIPLASTLFIAANDARPDWRDGATLLASLLLLGTVRPCCLT
jgi:hypothetical protein